jgi:hypothetical protein
MIGLPPGGNDFLCALCQLSPEGNESALSISAVASSISVATAELQMGGGRRQSLPTSFLFSKYLMHEGDRSRSSKFSFRLVRLEAFIAGSFSGSNMSPQRQSVVAPTIYCFQ